MRLGEFDPEDMNPYNEINTSVIQSSEHREMAIKAAMRSFVLMKNDKNVLPLKSKVSNLAVSQFQYFLEEQLWIQERWEGKQLEINKAT